MQDDWDHCITLMPSNMTADVLPAQIVENCEQRLSTEQQEDLLAKVQKHLPRKAS